MKLLYLVSLLFLHLLPGDSSPAKLQGVVVDKDNRPIPNAYLFVVKGEEETITGSNGQFALTTWQQFPVSLSVEHPNYKKLKLVVKEAGQKHVIKLEQ